MISASRNLEHVSPDPVESSQTNCIYYDILDGTNYDDAYYVEGEDRLDCAQLDQQGRKDLIALAFALCFFILLFFIVSLF
jgi:hypothetical protein